MRLLVSVEQRFDRTPDGAVWTGAGQGGDTWDEHLAIFDGVTVLGRLREVAEPAADARRADGPGVAFAAVPHYVGPWQYLARRTQVRRAIAAAVDPGDAVLLRLPSQIAVPLRRCLGRRRGVYGVQLLGDPDQVFRRGAVNHPLRPLLRALFVRRVRRACAGACAVAYVSGRVLPLKYPPHAAAYATCVSDVDLPDPAFVAAPRPERAPAACWELVSVGSLEQLYKAPDVLIDALALCRSRHGLDLRLALIGDGRLRPRLERRARIRGVGAAVHFVGQLPAGAPVRERLDAADLFVLASRTEGLPRALLEAMARALPALGSHAGGIPELLPEEDRVPAGDAAALAGAITALLRDPRRLAQASARNLERARGYASARLAPARLAFLRELRARTRDR